MKHSLAQLNTHYKHFPTFIALLEPLVAYPVLHLYGGKQRLHLDDVLGHVVHVLPFHYCILVVRVHCKTQVACLVILLSTWGFVAVNMDGDGELLRRFTLMGKVRHAKAFNYLEVGEYEWVLARLGRLEVKHAIVPLSAWVHYSLGRV